MLVACSGGLDSTVLLHLLRFAVPGRGVTVRAAHYDHAMRATSVADAAWVRGLATAWRVPLELGRASVPPRHEAGARHLRYRFLHEAAKRARADVVLTAHHADDQAETVLLRLLRGTGVQGLAGIAEKRGIVVRPLLPFRRAELLDYARDQHLRWREDPTNLEAGYARNRIRHRLVPVLEELRPGASARLAQLAAEAAQVERLLAPLLDDALTATMRAGHDTIVLAAPQLLVYDPWVRARVMRRAFQQLGSVPGRGATRAALRLLEQGRSGTAITLEGGLRLEREFDRLVVRRSDPQPVPPDQPLRIETETGKGTARIGGQVFQVAWGREPCGEGRAVALDASRFALPLVVRGWQPGDRIRLGYGTKKLRKLFGERRLARAERLRVPVVADAAGDVLCIVGVASAARVEPRPDRATLYLTVWE